MQFTVELAIEEDLGGQVKGWEKEAPQRLGDDTGGRQASLARHERLVACLSPLLDFDTWALIEGLTSKIDLKSTASLKFPVLWNDET